MTPKEAAERISEGEHIDFSEVDGSIADVVREGKKTNKESRDRALIFLTILILSFFLGVLIFSLFI